MAVAPQGYTIVSAMADGRRRYSARMVCRCCGAHHDLALANNARSPNFVADKARQLGWDARPDRPAAWRCAACVSATPKPDPDEPLRKVLPMKPQPVTPKPATVREATPEEKRRVREKLDGYFDEAKGMYLDGYSDQRVGKELDLPWAMVAKLREAAYGPIRADPEIEGIKAGIATLTAEAAKLATRLEAVEKRFRGAA